ncbi:TetR/AcrR family transcriptional regulator [Pseudomonas sp. RC10]|uniref:TetR/AcrR family transcriptional regulator n=1 Tax=Pseudomonas bambusae TaxID=3139142 RepID=UPI003139C1BF
MGHSQAGKKLTHDRIVSIAARRFREHGIDGLSINDLMKEAGLTHGGFYKHFESREQLVAEALAAAFAGYDSPERASPVTLEALVAEYLSPTHRDAIGFGCAVSALVNDVGRVQGEARDLYTSKLRSNVDQIAALLVADKESDSKRRDAIVAFSTMVGALGLARAVSDSDLSSEILEVARESLLHTLSAK